jgi:hypothetical protein
LYSAPHNEVKEHCATHKYMGLAPNTGGLRNGSLIFWKLAPPNLIPGLVRLPTDSLKGVCEQHLSQNSDLIGQPGRNCSLVKGCEQGNIPGPMGTISPHEPVIKIEIGTGK